MSINEWDCIFFPYPLESFCLHPMELPQIFVHGGVILIFSDFLHCVIPIILVCKLRNNTITSPVVILSGTFNYCF